MNKKIILPDDIEDDNESQEIQDMAFFDKYIDHSWVHNAWLGLGNTSHLKLKNPILERTQEDIENPGLHLLRIMRQPSYLSFAAKTLLGINLLPMQSVILEELWNRPFPMLIASRGWGKTWLLAVYSILKCILSTNTKIVVAGAAFRQSKFVFEYAENIWNNADILRSICDHHSGPRRETDRCVLHINNNTITAIPIGTGEKIRGLRAKIVIAEEFSSHSPDIYETVIAGFAAVSSDPVINVQEHARKEALENLGLWTDELQQQYLSRDTNQAIISGSAYFSFNHFYDYWKKYKSIIESKGEKNKLEQALGGSIPNGFNWRDYSIIRIPYELIPKGFMDEKIVARAKATVHSGIYLCEYGAVFSTDSDGFFKRSLIESCVVSDTKPIQFPKSGNVLFEVSLRGDSNKKYVIGVDPASEQDNFSIVVLELNEDHTRIVYCWTTNRQNFKKRLSLGMTMEHDFYKFTARKIHDLMSVFPCIKIAMDSQGGGIAVAEALQDPANLKSGEQPIYPVIDEDKEKDTDDKPGLHILELCNFAKYEWVRDANHGLRKDLEDKVLLFPRFDAISLGLAADRDADIRDAVKKAGGKTFDFIDSFDDCIMEIEELKNEMSTITVTVTGTGVNARERWDVPEIKLPGNKKGRMRKDRYSALLMANMVARQMIRADLPIQYQVIGGFAKDLAFQRKKKNVGQLYYGPEWFQPNSWGKNFGLVNKRR